MSVSSFNTETNPMFIGGMEPQGHTYQFDTTAESLITFKHIAGPLDSALISIQVGNSPVLGGEGDMNNTIKQVMSAELDGHFYLIEARTSSQYTGKMVASYVSYLKAKINDTDEPFELGDPSQAGNQRFTFPNLKVSLWAVNYSNVVNGIFFKVLKQDPKN